MTVEAALLLALSSASCLWLVRANHDRGSIGPGWAGAPAWLSSLARRGPGPVHTMSLAFEAYLLGVVVLGMAVAATETRVQMLDRSLAAWLGGGIVCLFMLDVGLSIRDRLRK